MPQHPALIRLPADRAGLLARFAGDTVPTLWCPLLTHYTADGAIDAERIRRHLDFLAPSVRGFLAPGSTGDGWQLADDEVRALLEVLVGEAAGRRLQLLIGVLKRDAEDMLRTIDNTLAWLRARSGAGSDDEALTSSSVCGFTVCPPSGKDRTQAQIRAALEAVLAKGLPTALYQLPQVTDNEMSPDTVAELAGRYPNFLLLKDTSGADRVAASGLRDVFLVRGAEGAYATHLAEAGGAYDGFLLSTANAFGAQYAELIAHLRGGRRAEADALSARIDAAVGAVFAAAAALPHGNAFTNANKALDHFMAHGPQARRVGGPRLHGGHTLPADLIDAAGDALERAALMPQRGYLEP
jgi:dihydrodipicolinate synthase/N-acetylneuraminate lyase